MFTIIKRITAHWPKEYRRRLKIGFIYSFFNSIFSALPVMGTAYALNLVIQNDAGERQMSVTDIWLVFSFMIIVVLGRFLTSYLRAVTQDSIAYEVTANERVKIGDILSRVSLGFFNRTSAGEIASAVTTDLSMFEMHAMSMIDRIVGGYIYIGVVLLSLLFYSLQAAVIAAIGILLSASFLKLLGNRSSKNAVMHQETIDKMTSATLEYIRGMAVVKAFKQNGAAKEGISKAYKEGCEINIQIEKQYVGCNCLHLFSLRAASAAIMGVVAVITARGGMDMKAMLLMIIFSFVMFGHLERLSDAIHVLENLDNTLNKLDTIHDTQFIDTEGKDIALRAYDVQFDHVSFAYDQKKVLNDVSFSVSQNTTTAIVGPSGSGKSTICNLIARFYDCNSGNVLVGGIDVRKMRCDSLLANISMVFQRVYLFHDSIINNIRFGKPDASMDDIIKAAKKARCHDFIMNLPAGYDTIIADGGATLSGGEKQRISIARAMLKDAAIIILDEATASVDPENEALIQQAIGELVHGKTIIIIAHRLATIQNADQILVVDGGQIVQCGRHERLMNCEGVYQRFMNIRQSAEGWSL